MRVKGDKINIDQENVRVFFKERASKHNEEKPYVTVLYQDKNPELARARNDWENSFIIDNLPLTPESRVLELGCGNGRLAGILKGKIHEYVGFDFSQELVDIAIREHGGDNFFFQQMCYGDLNTGEELLRKPPFDIIIQAGVAIYMNDDELIKGLLAVKNMADTNTTFLFREPVAIKERLTLKEFYSDDLECYYNAIYRTHDEYFEILSDTVLKYGFHVKREGFLYPDHMNIRKESAMYYFILSRND